MATEDSEELRQERVRKLNANIPKPEPRIEASIWPIGDGQWAMGKSMVCERIAAGASAPSDTITTWKDGRGVDYCLRPQTPRLPVPEYNDANAPVIPWNWSSAIFEIGHDVLVKVKCAPVGSPCTEGQSMRLARERAPSVPVPEAIHFWVDEEWDRYFVITRRVHGVLLDHVWFNLSLDDKRQVAKELVAHMKSLAEIKAPRYQNADGSAVADAFLISNEKYENPFKPLPDGWPGPFTPEELREHILESSDGLEPPEIGPAFHFCHSDMSPSNVILSGTDEAQTEGESHVHVAGIIDWERAAFYPKWWITLYIIILGWCSLSLSEEQAEADLVQGNQYIDYLLQALDGAGFPDPFDSRAWFDEYSTARNKVDTRRNKAAIAARQIP